MEVFWSQREQATRDHKVKISHMSPLKDFFEVREITECLHANENNLIESEVCHRKERGDLLGNVFE